MATTKDEPVFDTVTGRLLSGDDSGDGMTDDERRIAKQKERDAEQREVDRAGDAERARQEKAQGEADGARGRVLGDREQVSTKTGKPVKAAPRKATGTSSK